MGEQKAHENWIAAKQAEKRLAEFEEEFKVLKSRLAVVDEVTSDCPPDFPALPGMINLPTLSLPGMPQTTLPNLPGYQLNNLSIMPQTLLSNLPTLHNLPSMPNLPAMPNLPSLPGMPNTAPPVWHAKTGTGIL